MGLGEGPQTADNFRIQRAEKHEVGNSLAWGRALAAFIPEHVWTGPPDVLTLTHVNCQRLKLCKSHINSKIGNVIDKSGSLALGCSTPQMVPMSQKEQQMLVGGSPPTQQPAHTPSPPHTPLSFCFRITQLGGLHPSSPPRHPT